MPNVIKYTTGVTETGSLRKGNMLIGNNTADYGPTFYTGVTPPDEGYTIYLNKATGGPSIICPQNDEQLIYWANSISGQTFTNVSQSLNYFAGQSDKIVVNRDYEGITTDGLVLNLDAGFTPSYPTTETTWYDISGEGNNGTLTNGPTFSISGSGSIVFDGTNDYVIIPENNILKTDPTGSFTRMAWFNMAGYEGSAFQQVVWHKRTIFGINQDTVSVPGVDKEIYSYIGVSYTGTGVPVNLNTWYHATLIYDNTSVAIYVNGVLKNTNTVTLESQDGVNFDIGVVNETANYFNGNVSMVTGYNQALSQFDIWQNFNALKGRYGIPDIVTDGLVLNLDAGNPYSYLSGSSGTTWTDVSGEGNNGTLTNGASYENGAIVFDGVDDYVQLNKTLGLNYNKTFIFWLNFNGETGSVYHLLNRGTSFSYRDRVFISENNLSLYYSNLNSQVVFTFSENIKNKNKQIGFTVDSNNIYLIEDGTITQQTSVTFPDGDRVYQTIGAQSANSSVSYYKGNIYNTQVYNRALTQTEITQNFNALRGRYGI